MEDSGAALVTVGRRFGIHKPHYAITTHNHRGRPFFEAKAKVHGLTFRGGGYSKAAAQRSCAEGILRQQKLFKKPSKELAPKTESRSKPAVETLRETCAKSGGSVAVTFATQGIGSAQWHVARLTGQAGGIAFDLSASGRSKKKASEEAARAALLMLASPAETELKSLAMEAKIQKLAQAKLDELFTFGPSNDFAAICITDGWSGEGQVVAAAVGVGSVLAAAGLSASGAVVTDTRAYTLAVNCFRRFLVAQTQLLSEQNPIADSVMTVAETGTGRTLKLKGSLSVWVVLAEGGLSGLSEAESSLVGVRPGGGYVPLKLTESPDVAAMSTAETLGQHGIVGIQGLALSTVSAPVKISRILVEGKRESADALKAMLSVRGVPAEVSQTIIRRPERKQMEPSQQVACWTEAGGVEILVPKTGKLLSGSESALAPSPFFKAAATNLRAAGEAFRPSTTTDDWRRTKRTLSGWKAECGEYEKAKDAYRALLRDKGLGDWTTRDGPDFYCH